MEEQYIENREIIKIERSQEITNDNNTKDNHTNDNELSNRLLLDLVLREYDIEMERQKSLNSRVGIFLALIGVIITFMPNVISIKSLNGIDVGNAVDAVPYVLDYLINIVIYILLVISLVLFIKVINSNKNYRRIEFNSFKQKYSNYKFDELALAYMENYKKILINNKKINDIKFKFFSAGIICLFISIILILFSLIISSFIK